RLFGEPHQDCFEDGDLARCSPLPDVNLAVENAVQDGRFVFRPLRPAPRIAATAWLELVRLRRPAVADLASDGLRRRRSFVPAHGRLPRFDARRAVATSSKVLVVSARTASRLVKACQRRTVAST